MTTMNEMNKMNNDLQTNGVQEYEIAINVTPKTFAGLTRQGMQGQQACFELCDNGLAAALAAMKARICVALGPDRDENYIQMAVADWGCGMDLEALANALQLGSQSLGDNRLNEHGYGLNNALACLSGGSGDWCIYTRTQSGPYFKVSGPFDMKMTVKTVDALDLPQNLNLQWPDPSTVVWVRVPARIARTMQRRAGRKVCDLANLRTWLVEHLGVAYRGYLELDPVTLEPGAKMVVTVGESGLLVPPVPVPVMMPHTEKLELELGGQVVTATYVYGTLDKAKQEQLVLGKRSRYYYQCSQPTQGIDIRLGKRVIAMAQLDEIWQSKEGRPLSRHNSYNDFVGELILPELPRGVLPTLNNKTGIDRNDPDWEVVTQALAEFPPPKNAACATEQQLRERWMKILRAANPEDEVTSEISVWPTGTRVDVVHRDDKDRCDIYELKVHKAEPQHLYQLKMYWDGLVLEGVQPTRGYLLAAEYSDNLLQMARKMNGLPTPPFPDGSPSQPYRFVLATHGEKQLLGGGEKG